MQTNEDRQEPAAVARARRYVGRGHFLRGAGGRSPAAEGPEGPVGPVNGRVGCDGPGFVAWCLGYDRYQPGFAGGWDWVGPDSMILEAESSGRWFRPLGGPEVGALIVYPSIELARDGRTDRPGHVGLIAATPPAWTREEARWAALRVIHCAASLQRRYGHAIDETHAVAWSGRASFQGRSHPRWRTRFLRYVRVNP